MERRSQAFVKIGFKTLDRANDRDMRDRFQQRSIRYRGRRLLDCIASSARSSAGGIADCEVSVHLQDADATDKNYGGVPYQTGNGYSF